ncbi:MAG: hypothetical protein M0Z39_09655 [Actinomycetota bacterium]|jgi:hypothetical protein|nr:hypothetical protein [Actinomycetota bacterium]
MSALTWTEYLEELTRYLESMRLAIDVGTSLPETPAVPSGELPLKYLQLADDLALELQKLASDVSQRLVQIDNQLSLVPRTTRRPRPPATYIEVNS